MVCSICKREIPKDREEDHHLTPRCKKGKDVIIVCCDCGNQIHQLFSIQDLARTFNTLEALINEPHMQTWIRWIRKRKDFGFCMKEKKKKKS
jgi:hypothetical protein